ncbi:MAG: exodeoxyribonuclease VII small subunit [Bacteroidetes bacterium]|nr:exodeoxyribonuclease VII small subunit [Bacteroidota bacterium]
MKDENLTYEGAAAELETILAELESGKIGIDQLALKVERAGMLLRFCHDKLRDTEQKVSAIIADLGL